MASAQCLHKILDGFQNTVWTELSKEISALSVISYWFMTSLFIQVHRGKQQESGGAII